MDLPDPIPASAKPKKEKSNKIDQKQKTTAKKRKESLKNTLKGAINAREILKKVLTSKITLQIQKLLKLSKQIKDLIFKRRKVFDTKNQKKRHVEGKLNLIIKRKLILIASNPKLKIKINGRKPIITILNSKAEINVITCKAANKFNLAIK